RISIDSQDRITQIQDGNNAILGSYWYDESGFRIRKSSLEPKNNVFSNVEILYPSKFFGLEFIESENVISSVNNVYLNGVRIAALNEAGALAYYLTDQVDSVSTVLDDEGNTLSLMQYLPYGETFVQRGDTNFAPKFNSQELDRESGFYFFNARFYDPGIARFTSADTIIDGELDTQGWNRFSYVKGNPIGAKDPTGHCSTLSTVPCKTQLELGGGGVPPVGRPGSSSGGGNSAGLGAAATGLLANLLGSKDDKSSLPDKPRSTSATPSEAKDMSKAGLDPLNKSDVKNFLDKGNKSGVTHGGNSGTNNKVNNIPNAGGVIRKFTQKEDDYYYRVFSGDNITGGFLTKKAPKSSAWAQEALSLPPGNKANFIQKVLVPKGTELTRSRATPVPEWGRMRGGAEQFELRSKISPKNFSKGEPLP
ncbi:RHS repeat-associated core domain-containing protein, partial [Leptospira interrogans]|uniref:RHS repeat-associated core domain-containing protein n=2 Tax=Leptospira interrogans TaxID=173 RepID=UPI0007742467